MPMAVLGNQEKLEESRRLFKEFIKGHWPIIEHASFTFLLEGVPIALREQMVRHRLGVKMGDNLSADIIPDLANSSFWVQSMRVLDMSRFAVNGEYHEPASVANGPPQVKQEYHTAMFHIQSAYEALVNSGIPVEDARMILPLATTQNVVWTMNLMAIKHIIGKRTCWVAQSGFWQPVIEGIVGALSERFGDLFSALLNPPCIDADDKFTGCIYKDEMAERVQGKLPLPPCSLYLYHHGEEAKAVTGAKWREVGYGAWASSISSDNGLFFDQKQLFARFWGRNPHSGERTYS